MEDLTLSESNERPRWLFKVAPTLLQVVHVETADGYNFPAFKSQGQQLLAFG